MAMQQDAVAALRIRVRDRVHRCQEVREMVELLRRSLSELRDGVHVGRLVNAVDPAEQMFVRWWGLPHLTRLACRHPDLYGFLSCPELLHPLASPHGVLPLVSAVLRVLLQTVRQLPSGERRVMMSAAQDLLDVCQDAAFVRLEGCLSPRLLLDECGWNPWPAPFAAHVEEEQVLSGNTENGLSGTASADLPGPLVMVLVDLIEVRHLLDSAEPLACRLTLRLRARPDWAWLLAKRLSPPVWRRIGHVLSDDARHQQQDSGSGDDAHLGWVPVSVAYQHLRGTPGIGALQTVRRLLPAWRAQGWARKTAERRNAVYEVDVQAVRGAYLDGYRTASWGTYRRHPKGWAYDARHDPPIPVRRRSRRR